MINLIKKKINLAILRIENKVPYIPDFSQNRIFLNVFIVSFWILCLYTFITINNLSEFYSNLGINIQKYSYYVIFELFILVFSAKKINKMKSFYAIIYILLTTVCSTFLIYSMQHQSFMFFFNNLNESIISMIVSIGIVFLSLIYFDWKEKNIDPSNNLAKLSFLQSKMKPHFLFNTLNSIAFLIKNNPENAKKMILNLSDLLRVSLKEQSLTEMHELKKELVLCQKYLDIEKIRLGERLNVLQKIDSEALEALVPKLSIQPLIENAILHGIQNIEEGGEINIFIQKNKNYINIKIENPINIEKINNTGNNISTENLKERLNLYYNYDVVFKKYIEQNNFITFIEVPILVEIQSNIN